MRAFHFALALSLPLPAAAASAFMADASDLWWNRDESGWGVNIIQQSNVLFATFFIYGSDSRARWYVASEMRCPNTPTDMQMVCRGTLYETTGPVVRPGFNPASVTRRAVGDALFLYSRRNSGQFVYTIDGVTVSQEVRRQTWAINDITGEFNGMRVTRPSGTGCSIPSGARSETLGTMTVTQSGSTATINAMGVPPIRSCTYTGTFAQEGRMSAITDGTYSCTDGSSGTFDLTEIEVSKLGFLGRFFTRTNGCNLYGHLGGTRMSVEQAPD